MRYSIYILLTFINLYSYSQIDTSYYAHKIFFTQNYDTILFNPDEDDYLNINRPHPCEVAKIVSTKNNTSLQGLSENGFFIKELMVSCKRSKDISQRYILTIPENLNQLTRLDRISICGFDSIVGIENLRRSQSIEYLDISNNRLKEIPDNLYRMYQLKHLDLSHNHLEKFSNKLSWLINLEFLDLSYNQVEKYPVSLELTKLKKLKLLIIDGWNASEPLMMIMMYYGTVIEVTDHGVPEWMLKSKTWKQGLYYDTTTGTSIITDIKVKYFGKFYRN